MESLVSPWRQYFPGLQHLASQGQIWLDSAATAQKPQAMIQTLLEYYQLGAANVHRAQHAPGERATRAYEDARHTAARWLNAPATESVVFTKGSTESLNLLSHALADSFAAGDEIVLSGYEHHANLLPWQQLAQRKQLTLRIAFTGKNGEFDPISMFSLIGPRTRLIAISPLSNVLGKLQDIRPVLALARERSILSLVDAAQYAVHQQPDVQQLNCDFLVCSSHKLYGPDGVGLLYAHPSTHQHLKPWQWGGEMVAQCDWQHAQARSMPLGFEAGTPSIANVIAFAATLNWLMQQDNEAIQAYEQSLFQRLLQGLQQRDMVILGQPDTALVCFNAPQVHPADLAALLSEQGIAVRGGQHCAMPLFQHLKLAGAVRVSLAMYNDSSDLNAFFSALDNALELLA